VPAHDKDGAEHQEGDQLDHRLQQPADKPAARQEQRDQLGREHDQQRQQRHLADQLQIVEHGAIGAAGLIDDVDLIAARQRRIAHPLPLTCCPPAGRAFRPGIAAC
jgi:hypothetical protein